ncbi:MAG: hypothetical protein LBJ96_05700 [Holosporaceae bacterium]|jgi:hypothetical protein|nr:hypothetical protein [Holosporaceae bacterium]
MKKMLLLAMVLVSDFAFSMVKTGSVAKVIRSSSAPVLGNVLRSRPTDFASSVVKTDGEVESDEEEVMIDEEGVRIPWASPRCAPTVCAADVRRLIEIFGEAIAGRCAQEMNEEKKADYIRKLVMGALNAGSGNPWRGADILCVWLWKK